LKQIEDSAKAVKKEFTELDKKRTEFENHIRAEVG